MYNPYDFYFKKAKTQWFKARSVFKLEEIQNKFKIFGKDTNSILDIWCFPGSWLQYAYSQMQKFEKTKYQIIWMDIKDVKISLPGVKTFNQDITDQESVKKILEENGMKKIDLIISDMAPNTIGFKNIDAIRSFALIEKTIWIYKQLLKPDWKFVVKVFMWPWFEEYVKDMRNFFGAKNIKIYKPSSSRTESKETYVIKI